MYMEYVIKMIREMTTTSMKKQNTTCAPFEGVFGNQICKAPNRNHSFPE